MIVYITPSLWSSPVPTEVLDLGVVSLLLNNYLEMALVTGCSGLGVSELSGLDVCSWQIPDSLHKQVNICTGLMPCLTDRSLYNHI